MRVNPNMLPSVLSGLQQSQTTLDAALQEVSTGKRVQVPSDDPAASANMVQNTIDMKNVDQYTQNVSSVLSMVQTADSTLSAVVTSMTQAVTLGVEGANGTSNATNQKNIAIQVQGILDSIVSAANTSYQGSYLFGGTANTVAPYTADATSASGYTYNGNSGVNSVAVGDTLNVQLNLPGDQIFSNPSNDVIGSLASLVSALKSGNTATIKTATDAVSSALSFVSSQRVIYGNTESQLNAQDTYLQQETVSLTSQQKNLVGIDMATAATDLAQAQTANSAALAAAAKVLPTTLLNYLSPVQ
jgi:flagellar hook-associated protein 3 FlgL